MNAELQAHLDGLTDRYLAAGMTPEEARRAAQRDFGVCSPVGYLPVAQAALIPSKPSARSSRFYWPQRQHRE